MLYYKEKKGRDGMERYRGPDFDEMMPQVFAAI